MSRGDAYEEEMGFLRRLTTDDEERLIAGDAPVGGELAEVAGFARALRASASQNVPPASAALIARLAETARASAGTTQEHRPVRPARPRRRLALVARVAVAVATVPLLFAGLAFAGVNLPGPADEAFESVGVELPNQTADDDTEGTAKDGDSAGSATGQENSSGKLGHGRTKPKNGKALGHAKGKALGKNGVAPGQTREPGSQSGDNPNAGGANAGGDSGSSGCGGGSGKSSGGSGGASGDSSGGGPPAGKGPSK